MLTTGTTINKTHFRGDLTKLYNSYRMSKSFKYYYDRRSELRQRLHFEYEYTRKHFGRAFCWTLTYNDDNISKIFEHNVHNYVDVKKFFNSLNTHFSRNYGYGVKYAVFCELGEKKGSREINPHYHVACFFNRLDKSNKYYQDEPSLPSDSQIYNMAKFFWQGGRKIYDSKHRVCYLPEYEWTKAKHGSIRYSTKAHSGLYGYITSERALAYCIKYCMKDVLKFKEQNDIYTKMLDFCESQKELWTKEYFQIIEGSKESFYEQSLQMQQDELDTYFAWRTSVCMGSLIKSFNSINSTKPRLSHNIGHYSDIANTIQDGYFLLPNKKGLHVSTKLKGYFFRKHFYTVEKRENERLLYPPPYHCNGTKYIPGTNDLYTYDNIIKNAKSYEVQNYYRPKSIYLAYRLQTVEKTQSLIVSRTRGILQGVENSTLESLREYASSIGENNSLLVCSRDNLLSYFSDKVISDYALYKTIYEFRPLQSYDNDLPNISVNPLTRDLDPKTDYEYFLTNDYNSDFTQISQPPSCCLDYSYHTYFRDTLPCFHFLDLVSDYLTYTNYSYWANEEYKERKKNQSLNNTLYESKSV